ncbi:MAG TPA: class I SAM-dependent methyltransferase [Fibrobacteria bacterium]|nr:class I SAM-dependent methyltransferase [Fibrobacteria bacterium]
MRASTEAYRLLNGAASGVPGLAVDVFGGHLVVYAYADGLESHFPGLARILEEVTGASGAALKDRAAPDETGREEGGELFGEVPETADVREATASGPAAPDGLRFRVHLRHPRNVGLFLDTRPLREALLRGAAGAEVLNLFSYSCSLGAAAAGGGAASVVNVDISARYLGWGRENARLSGLPEDRIRFTRMDGEAYLDWAARKGRTFDTVILDPPSFSRARLGPADVKIFAFEKDYFRLLSKAAGRLRPGGRVYAVTNYGGILPERFREAAREAVAVGSGATPRLHPLSLPPDFDPGPEGTARQAAREGAYLAVEAVLPD